MCSTTAHPSHVVISRELASGSWFTDMLACWWNKICYLLSLVRDVCLRCPNTVAYMRSPCLPRRKHESWQPSFYIPLSLNTHIPSRVLLSLPPLAPSFPAAQHVSPLNIQSTKISHSMENNASRHPQIDGGSPLASAQRVDQCQLVVLPRAVLCDYFLYVFLVQVHIIIMLKRVQLGFYVGRNELFGHCGSQGLIIVSLFVVEAEPGWHNGTRKTKRWRITL